MVTFLSFVIYGIFVYYQRGSYMVWEINTGVCPRLEFDNIMFINCLRHDFYIYVHLIFLCKSFANLWRHVWYHYHALGYQVIIISKVLDISCNGPRNVLWNNDIIDKFVDTMNGFACIRLVGGHSFLLHGTPIFNCIFCIQSTHVPTSLKFKNTIIMLQWKNILENWLSPNHHASRNWYVQCFILLWIGK